MAVYYLVPNGAKNIVLLLASLFFYAWGEPVYVVLMILSIVLNYFCGRDIEANADNPKKAKLSLVFALTANILILGFFKYYGFLLDTVNSFLTTVHSLQSAPSADRNLILYVSGDLICDRYLSERREAAEE